MTKKTSFCCLLGVTYWYTNDLPNLGLEVIFLKFFLKMVFSSHFFSENKGMYYANRFYYCRYWTSGIAVISYIQISHMMVWNVKWLLKNLTLNKTRERFAIFLLLVKLSLIFHKSLYFQSSGKKYSQVFTTDFSCRNPLQSL